MTLSLILVFVEFVSHVALTKLDTSETETVSVDMKRLFTFYYVCDPVNGPSEWNPM